MKQHMKKSVMLMLVGVALLISACRDAAMTTPESTFKIMREAILNDDHGAMWDCMCRESQETMSDMFRNIEVGATIMSAEEFEKQFEKDYGMSPEAFAKLSARERFIRMCEKSKEKSSEQTYKEQKERAKNWEIVGKREEGGKVILITRAGDEYQEITLVKEDDLWKVVMVD